MQYVANMPLNQIVSGQNPRTFFCPTKLEELCSTIKAHGVFQPILVKSIGTVDNPQYQIIAGERRWRASIMAFGLDSGSIPVLIKEEDSDEESRRIALIENIQREQMSPPKKAMRHYRFSMMSKETRQRPCAFSVGNLPFSMHEWRFNIWSWSSKWH